MTSKLLLEISNNEELIEIARRAIEDAVLSYRDSGLMMPLRNNGVVCKWKDGTPSDIIRFGPETAMCIGLEAIAKHLQTVEKPDDTNVCETCEQEKPIILI